MRFIGFEREEEAEAWVRQKADINEAPDFFRAMSAVDDDGNFACAVVVTNFTPRNVDFTLAMDAKKMTPQGTIDTFNGIFGFAFNTLKVARITALVPGKNTKSKNICERFGFKLEGIMRNVFDDDDLHVYGFLAEDYTSHRWRKD